MGIWEHFRGKSRVMSERRMRDMSDELREDAFLEDAMERYGDAVYRLALCRLGSRADAEDVYQDVFLRLLRDTTAFRDGEHLKAWLLRVTLHCCVDLRRSAWWKRTAPLEAAAERGEGRALAGGRSAAGRSAYRRVAALCRGLRHGRDRGNRELPSGNGTDKAASRTQKTANRTGRRAE